MSDLSSLVSQGVCDSPKNGAEDRTALGRMAELLDKFLETVSSRMFLVSVLAVAFMSIPIFIDVVARLFWGSSVTGIVEIEEFLMVIIVFLALGYTHKKEGHIAIDLLTCKLPAKVNRCLDIFNQASCMVFFGIMS
jgi:TRAP-type C4-dicarboxylate transport system permease small subunit